MSPAPLHPRPDQIAELTRLHPLPLAPVPGVHVGYILRTIVRVWVDLAGRHAAKLTRDSEVEISALLKTSLCNQLEHDRRWHQLVRTVTRGEESFSFDGSHIEKRPDLSIHLRSRNPNFPLTVECKIIDGTSGKGTGLYRTKGVDRFTSGEYAWAASEAFMLAYVRDGSTLSGALAPELSPIPLDGMTLAGGSVPPPTAVDLARSVHERTFRYVGRLSPDDEPGPITLVHLWLQ